MKILSCVYTSTKGENSIQRSFVVRTEGQRQERLRTDVVTERGIEEGICGCTEREGSREEGTKAHSEG